MKNKKAIALVLAIFILVFVAILGVAFWEVLSSDLVIVNNHLGRLKALYIAEAGIEYAISQLRNNKNWSVSGQETTFPVGANSSYTLTYPKPGTSRIIESSAQVDNKFRAVLQVQVSIQGQSSPYIVRILSFKETG